jgi:protocatechuate 3,4-dioxygenase beta subunit
MKIRYALISLALIALVAQLGIAQGGPDMPPGNHMQLMFVSTPPLFGRVDVPYAYTAVAHAKDSTAVIHYFADPFNPPGFAIDSVSGVVTWTPKLAGWYPISILARSNMGETGLQRFMVTVTSGNGIVQGKVTDTLGVGIPGIVIEILQAVNIGPMSFGCYSFAARTDMNGNYRLSNINPSSYLLHAISPTPQYLSQWYDGKATASEADRITVADSPAVTIANFVLRGGIAPLPMIAVAGSVQDTAGAPLVGAEVFFVRAGFALNANSTVEDFRRMFDFDGRMLDFHLDGRSVHVFRALSDSLGQYSLKVVPGLYIAFARAKGYAVSFYQNQSSPLTADRLQLGNDTSGIDFTLQLLPNVALGTIQGAVLDSSNGVGIPSRIIAMRDRWTRFDPHIGPRTFTVDTDSLGAYSLGDLPPGSYLVLALPMGSYAPAFYAADTSSSWWRRATPVDVNGNVVTGIDIYVHEIPTWAHGFTGVRGMIQADGGTSPAPSGALVYAERNSTIAGFGIADPTGHYEIAGLAPGSYTVTADLPGYDPVASKAATISYTSDGKPQFATVDLNFSTVATAVSENANVVPQTYELSQNYPNPFNPTTEIRFQVPVVSNVKLVVYNLLGQEVAVLVNERKEAGSYQVAFNGANLASGVYLYQLKAGSFVQTLKMLLVK